MRLSAASVWAALLTSRLKSSRMRLVATLPITAPKTSRMTSVRPAEYAARRQRTGQLLGRSRAGQEASALRGSLVIYSLIT